MIFLTLVFTTGKLRLRVGLAQVHKVGSGDEPRTQVLLWKILRHPTEDPVLFLSKIKLRLHPLLQ